MVGNRSGWPKSPRALAGRLRRAQTFLRTLGIEIGFGREGRLGTRTITITDVGESRSHNNVSIVSTRQPRQRQWARGGSKPSSARTGTGALIAQTMLTVLTISHFNEEMRHDPITLQTRVAWSVPLWSMYASCQ